MARCLIVYGTTDGHTAKIARFLGGELAALGARINLVEAGTDDPDPYDYDGVIVAASLHGGRFQRDVVSWVQGHAGQLPARPTAFLSVCLGVLQRDLKVQQELEAIVERFTRRTGWEPQRVKLVAGALLYTRYGWLKRLMMRSIAKRAGGATDLTRDWEYTDWADLREFAEGFFAQLPKPEPAPCGESCGCGARAVA